MKPLNLNDLRAAIEAAPADGVALLPTERSWLEQVEAEVLAGRDARAELEALYAQAFHIDRDMAA